MEPIQRLDVPDVEITDDMPESLVSFIRAYESLDQALISGARAIEFTHRVNEVLTRMQNDEYDHNQAIWHIEDLTEDLGNRLEEIRHIKE